MRHLQLERCHISLSSLVPSTVGSLEQECLQGSLEAGMDLSLIHI